MKNSIKILVLTLFMCFSVFSQEQVWSLRKNYKLGLDLTVSYLDGLTVKTRIAKKGLKYRYIQTVNDKVYIKFLKITKDTDLTEKDSSYVNAENDDVNYFVDKDLLDNQLYKLKTQSLVTGTLLTPIKIRPEKQISTSETIPWELSTDINLGQYLGYRFPLSRTSPYYLTVPTITFGTSLLSINSSNTNPETETSTTLGLTWSTGIILDLNGFNIGFLVGKDYAPGKTGDDWIYNEETWFSLGFGINLTSKNRDL